MRAFAALLVFGLCSLCGCTERPPVQAAWYYIQEDSVPYSQNAKPWSCDAATSASLGRPSERRNSYLALLNQSAMTISDISAIILNEDKDHSESAWTLETTKCRLEPGQIIMLPLAGFLKNGQPLPDCYVPVTVAIRQDGITKPIVADVSGGLPNAIPLEWQTRCGVHPA